MSEQDEREKYNEYLEEKRCYERDAEKQQEEEWAEMEHLRSDLAAAREEIATLKSVLKELEWKAQGFCVICREHRRMGHLNDCRLANLLEGA